MVNFLSGHCIVCYNAQIIERYVRYRPDLFSILLGWGAKTRPVVTQKLVHYVTFSEDNGSRDGE